jgi:transposase
VLPYADKLLRSLVVDRARWHTSEKVVVPEGIFLEYLPPYSPELQPAERLGNYPGFNELNRDE